MRTKRGSYSPIAWLAKSVSRHGELVDSEDVAVMPAHPH